MAHHYNAWLMAPDELLAANTMLVEGVITGRIVHSQGVALASTPINFYTKITS